MHRRFDAHFSSSRNKQLYLQKWAHQNAKATLIITHGQGEHSGSYEDFASELRDLPVDIIAWDLQGHGRSEGLRGHADNFREYVEDFYDLFENLRQSNWLRSPSIFMSHSMGALIQLIAFSEKPELQQEPTAGLIFSSPLWGLSLPVPIYKQQGAQWLSQLLPELTLSNEIRNQQLTRDPERIRQFETDPYRHNKISSQVYLGFLNEFSQLKSRAELISLPSLVLCSDHDPVVSSDSAREISLNLPQERSLPSKGNMLEYHGAKHELLNDIVRDQVIADIRRFINSLIEKT